MYLLEDCRGRMVRNLKRADTFANKFANTFTPHGIITNIIPNTSMTKGEPIRFFSFREIATELCPLNPKKTPGFDDVTANMLKELPKEGIMMLNYVCNTAPRLHYVPKIWKQQK